MYQEKSQTKSGRSPKPPSQPPASLRKVREFFPLEEALKTRQSELRHSTKGAWGSQQRCALVFRGSGIQAFRGSGIQGFSDHGTTAHPWGGKQVVGEAAPPDPPMLGGEAFGPLVAGVYFHSRCSGVRVFRRWHVGCPSVLRHPGAKRRISTARGDFRCGSRRRDPSRGSG